MPSLSRNDDPHKYDVKWCWWCHSGQIIQATSRTPFASCKDCGKWAAPSREEYNDFQDAHTVRGGQGSDRYKQYMQSAKWLSIRERKIKQAGNKCEKCGATGVTLQVHHKNYNRLYYERLSDLTALCLSCHPIADEERRASWQK